MPTPVVIGPDGQPVAPQPGAAIVGVQPPQTPATAPAAATPFKPAGERADGEERAAEGAAGKAISTTTTMENSLSLAAIEAELKPKVIETFDNIAGTYKRLRRLQDQDIQFQLKACRSRPRRNASIRSSRTRSSAR